MPQTRVGWRPGTAGTAGAAAAVSTLMQSLYGAWNGDASTNELGTQIYGAWNSEVANNSAIKNVWNGNGNAIDSKSGANGTIVTPNATTGYTTSSMTYSAGKLGTGSFTFNGGNFVSLPNNTFRFTGDFSVGCWFYVPADYVSNAYLISAFDNQGSYPTYFGWWISYDSTNKKIGFGIGRSQLGSYGNISISTANNSIVPGQWNHVAITRKSSTRSRIYINGNLSASDTSTANPVYSNGFSSLGSSYFAFSHPFWKAANAGLKMDGVFAFEAELDSDAILELYNSGDGQEYPFTVSNALISSPKDAVSTNHGTLQGGAAYTTGKIGSAFSFNGSTSYVQLPNDTFKPAGTFAVSFWVKLNTVATQAIFTNCSQSNNGFRITTTSANKIGFEFNGYSISGNAALAINTWYHICVLNTGSTYEIYINGSLDRTNVGQSLWYQINWGSAGTNVAYIGRYISAAYYLNGAVDSLTLWNRKLSTDEIVQLYNSGNGAQYPFTGTFSSAGNQFGMDNGTLMNGCSLTAGKIGQAFAFDGVNDYVQLPNNSLNFTGDFSTSFWFYANSFSGNPQDSFITCENWTSPNDNGWYIFHYQGNLCLSVYNGTNSTGWKTSTTITTGTWYHVVVIKNRSVSPKFYINGALVGSVLRNGTDTTLNPGYTTTQYCSLGADRYAVNTTQAYFNGKIDGVNVWQREITQTEVTELYNSGNGKQLTPTSIVQSGLVLNLDASRTSSYIGTGTTWTDISGNGNNGTLTNGPVFGTASGGEITFDGVDDYVNCGTLGNFGSSLSTNSITMEFAFKSSYTAGIKQFGIINSGSATLLCVNFNRDENDNYSAGKTTFSLRDNSGLTLGVSMNANIYSNSYFIVSVSRNISNNQVKFYVNGVPVNVTVGGSGYNSNPVSFSNFQYPFVIGAINNRGSITNYLNSSIPFFRIYSKALSDAEVLQNFNATKSRFGL